jgi:signal peptidase
MNGPDDERRSPDRSGSRDGGPGAERGPPENVGDSGPPSRTRSRTDDGVRIEDGVVRWFLEGEGRTVTAVRDLATIVTIVVVVSVVLTAISGAWPLLVAVESGSMEPHVGQGDLVFVVEEGRFAGDAAVAGTGVVTREVGRETGYGKFGNSGDVIVFRPDGDDRRTPVIHRAHFWVAENENWVETKADPGSMNGFTCTEIATCPAPHDGFVTKGDANPAYDQLPGSGSDTTVVRAEWITGKAMLRAPWLGQIRLAVGSIGSLTGVGSSAVLVASGAIALALLGAAAGGDEP